MNPLLGYAGRIFGSRPFLFGRNMVRRKHMDQQTQEKLLALVKDNYEEITVSFNSTRTKHIWPELVKLTAWVIDGDRILDVGCGNGRLLQALGGKNIEYLGLDGNAELIETAKSSWKMSASLRSGDWQFINGDILKLNKIPEQDFNYVYCIAVLHHLPGENLRVEALKQMKNKIKPDGKIILTVWNLWNQDKYKRLILKFALKKLVGGNRMDFGDIIFNWKDNQGQAVSQRYYHAFSKRELRKIAAKAGLKISKLYKDEHNYYLVLEN